MQNAKDSFYEMLRGRLSSLNPERTVVVRGVTRPGVLVDENETGSVAPLADCFHLRWTKVDSSFEDALPIATQSCEISYATSGSAWNGGLDRGRALAAMDQELLAALHASPQNATKYNYKPLQSGGAPVALNSRIWWSDVTFEAVKAVGEQLQRVAAVQVMAYLEAVEL